MEIVKKMSSVGRGFTKHVVMIDYLGYALSSRYKSASIKNRKNIKKKG